MPVVKAPVGPSGQYSTQANAGRLRSLTANTPIQISAGNSRHYGGGKCSDNGARARGACCRAVRSRAEVLYVINRTGNVPSHSDAARWIDAAIDQVEPYAPRVCVRGDTDFALTQNTRLNESNSRKAALALASPEQPTPHRPRRCSQACARSRQNQHCSGAERRICLRRRLSWLQLTLVTVSFGSNCSRYYASAATRLFWG